MDFVAFILYIIIGFVSILLLFSLLLGASLIGLYWLFEFIIKHIFD